MYYVNENIKNFSRIYDQDNRSGFMRLDLNENPGGLPEEFVRRVLASVKPDFIAQYPETLEFKRVLAKFLGCSTENLCLVNGSSEGIRHIIETFTSPDGKILGVVPTFAMFNVFAKMYGRKFVSVDYEPDLTLDTEKFLNAMTPDIQLAVVLNPNNPVGNVFSENDMQRILTKAAENEITLLIDEAYIYFYENEFKKYALENEHVFVTRTFSKLFSMAGCRFGYVLGQPDGIAVLQKMCTPHNVNAFAMKLAREVIETEGMIDKLISQFRAGKEFLLDSLKKNGYEFHAGEGNFIFIKPFTDAEILMNRLRNERNILVKTYDVSGKFGKCLRVTTGGREFMSTFMKALTELDRQG